MNEQTDEFIKKVSDQLITDFDPKQQGNILHQIITNVHNDYEQVSNDHRKIIEETSEQHELFENHLKGEIKPAKQL